MAIAKITLDLEVVVKDQAHAQQTADDLVLHVLSRNRVESAEPTVKEITNV